MAPHAASTLLIGFSLLPSIIVAASKPAAAHPPAIVGESGQRRIAEEIADFRKRMAAAIRAGRREEVQRMYAPVFGHVTEGGERRSREVHIGVAMAGRPVLETAEVRELVVRAPNDWVVIVTGTTGSREERAGEAGRRVRWTAVYTRAGESWQLAATHASPIGEPAARR
jgi:hypothetical protein